MSRSGAHGGGGDRKYAPRFRAVGRAIPGTDIESLCNELVRRMRWIRHKTQAGTYVLADSEGYVYVLREQACFAERVATQLSRMIVGLYATRSIYPSSAQLCTDLVQHFVDIDFIDIPPPNRG